MAAFAVGRERSQYRFGQLPEFLLLLRVLDGARTGGALQGVVPERISLRDFSTGEGGPDHRRQSHFGSEALTAAAIGRNALARNPEPFGQPAGLPEYVDRNAATRIPVAA